MAADTNRVTLLCRLARDPELRVTGSGTDVASLRIAWNTNAPDGDGGWGDKGNFMNAVVFGRGARPIADYCQKGHRILISGRLEMNEWTDRDGNKRQDIQLIADPYGVQFIEQRNDTPSQHSRSDMGASPAGGWSNAPSTPAHDDDDDIPF